MGWQAYGGKKKGSLQQTKQLVDRVDSSEREEKEEEKMNPCDMHALNNVHTHTHTLFLDSDQVNRKIRWIGNSTYNSHAYLIRAGLWYNHHVNRNVNNMVMISRMLVWTFFFFIAYCHDFLTPSCRTLLTSQWKWKRRSRTRAKRRYRVPNQACVVIHNLLISFSNFVFSFRTTLTYQVIQSVIDNELLLV